MRTERADAQQSLRCAIYTRKSTEAGLDREMNSLEAQRDTCSAYIRSQRHKGWAELPERYDDGGYSGASLVRPALQRLLTDIEAARIDVVVIYKIDRLTRSLVDFVRLVDTMERFDVSFVSITQSFDTSDSMGRLVLNVLLTFAQFERELLSDRLKDKFAALKRRGKWIGGLTPFGYQKVDKRLIVDEDEAAIVRMIYDRYPQVPSGNVLLRELRSAGVRKKIRHTSTGRIDGGHVFGPGLLHRILTNPLYLGKIEHQGIWYEGEQDAIVSREQWDLVQQVRGARHGAQIPREPTGNLLLGLLFDAHGRRMDVDTLFHSGKRYRYYVTRRTKEGDRQKLKTIRTNAEEIEQLVLGAILAMLCDAPEIGDALATLGMYEDDRTKLLKRGPAIAAQLRKRDAATLRHLYRALIRRIELDRERVRLMISCHELSRVLRWDGVGVFKPGAQIPAKHANRVHLLDVPASIVREAKLVQLPLNPIAKDLQRPPNPKLTTLLREAQEAREAVYSRRDRSVSEIARELGYGPSYFARLVRLTYLAPDIVAAIVDGHQPETLTRKQLMLVSMPLDWSQQRQLLGFRAALDDGRVRLRHNKSWRTYLEPSSSQDRANAQTP